MASMDGSPVLVGDSVYDTAYGTGTVAELMSVDRFRVSFPQGRTYVYSDAGVNTRFTIRTLFWRNPVIAVPAKNDNAWTAISAVCSAVVSAMRVNAG